MTPAFAATSCFICDRKTAALPRVPRLGNAVPSTVSATSLVIGDGNMWNSIEGMGSVHDFGWETLTGVQGTHSTATHTACKSHAVSSVARRITLSSTPASLNSLTGNRSSKTHGRDAGA